MAAVAQSPQTCRPALWPERFLGCCELILSACRVDAVYAQPRRSGIETSYTGRDWTTITTKWCQGGTRYI
jgi:hypothetical protein